MSAILHLKRRPTGPQQRVRPHLECEVEKWKEVEMIDGVNARKKGFPQRSYGMEVWYPRRIVDTEH
jgi:hypothetical protein